MPTCCKASPGIPNVTWDAHADELEYLKSEINDIGAKLCRLQTIRRVVAPWQQNVIDQIATDTQLMADNAQDAIVIRQHSPYGTLARHVSEEPEQPGGRSHCADTFGRERGRSTPGCRKSTGN